MSLLMCISISNNNYKKTFPISNGTIVSTFSSYLNNPQLHFQAIVVPSILYYLIVKCYYMLH